jgi:AcrR family transcriptional regulator
MGLDFAMKSIERGGDLRLGHGNADEGLQRMNQLSNKKGLVDRRAAARIRNRESILTAAHELFIEQGYEAVSIRDIIARAGLGLGTFYNHFEDKEELFRLLLDKHAAEVIDRLNGVRREAKSFPELIEKHFRVFFHEICEDPTSFEMFSRNVAVIRELTTRPAHWEGYWALRHDIDAAIKKGSLAPVNSELLTATIVAIQIELGAIVVRSRKRDPDEAARFCTELVLNGIARKKRKD